VAIGDAHGHYRGAFPVMYKPPAGNKQGVPVTVSVQVRLRNYTYWGTATRSFMAVPAERAPHITDLSIQLANVRGGRTAPCGHGYNRQGHVLPGCQIVTLTAPIQPRSHLIFTVHYPAAPELQQSFVATADAHGHYRGAFPVMYKPPAGSKGVPVRVTVQVWLRNYSYWGTTTLSFMDMPAG
jgi:hypothetical protein